MLLISVFVVASNVHVVLVNHIYYYTVSGKRVALYFGSNFAKC